MSNNIYCEKYESILKAIRNKGITTAEQLMNDSDLYAEFWMTAKNYIDSYVLNSKTSKNSKGQVTIGNYAKINELTKHSVCERNDIENDCLIRLLDKLNLILEKPLEAQPFFSYKTVNNVVNQACRDFLPPKNFIVVSLQDTVGFSSDEEEAFTYESLAADNVTPENKATEEDSLRCLENFYYSSLISGKPAEALAHLSKAIGMKNSTFKNMLLQKGIDFTVNFVIDKSKEELFDYLGEAKYKALKDVFNKITEESLKLSTNNSDVIGDQISKLRNRAKNELEKAYKRAKL